ncbi:uncharacterized protein TRIADDRAFT_61251 [Trichoplax adhaerens]|uniref:EGF-like domain-containing protein n=1 Tax=Trichoplax adhaerens TaxID=10228 RepID=B3SAG5_TRIAD|nr:hypothetical protein TRIADDRAFT_61251 [Trichoplax adhaerens]EDV20308.1 hypothetical protein TRIADDRAFT_61251 [Trichoplax adhaerens]|eukprot:XP_002117258.1 hypothetical protein TRIADDRAFT_61251 [Trichoplax adhaerens]
MYADLSLKTHKECLDKGLVCHRHAICVTEVYNDTLRYNCRCGRGFSGNGSYCEDIDECQYPKLYCPYPHQTCINKEGSHVCKCDAETTGQRFYSNNCSACTLRCPINGSSCKIWTNNVAYCSRTGETDRHKYVNAPFPTIVIAFITGGISLIVIIILLGTFFFLQRKFHLKFGDHRG